MKTRVTATWIIESPDATGPFKTHQEEATRAALIESLHDQLEGKWQCNPAIIEAINYVPTPPPGQKTLFP